MTDPRPHVVHDPRQAVLDRLEPARVRWSTLEDRYRRRGKRDEEAAAHEMVLRVERAIDAESRRP